MRNAWPLLAASLTLLATSSCGGGGAGAKPVPGTYALLGQVTIEGASGEGTAVHLVGASSAGFLTTSSGGRFEMNGVPPGTFTLTPSKPGYVFTPPSRTVTVVAADVSGLNFDGAFQPTTGITGTVSFGAGAGATAGLYLQGDTTTLLAGTDAAGHFIGTAPDGDYWLTPTMPGFTFSPAARLAHVTGGVAAGQDFVATAQPFCEPATWRWQNRQPQGLQLSSTWGSAPDDLWAVGYSLLHWDGATWRVDATCRVSMNSAWGSGSSDVWAVGEGGAIVHWNGTVWQSVPSPVSTTLWGVWGTGPSDAWAVGDAGVILHWTGASWSQVASGTGETLSTPWGSGPNDVWVVGIFGTVLHWNGGGWTKATVPTTADLIGVWGTSTSDVWVTGDFGTALHWNGTRWSSEATGIAAPLFFDYTTAPGDVWSIGLDGLIVHRTPAGGWTTVPAPTTNHLWSIWGLAADDLLAVGDAGTILRWDGAAWGNQTSGPAGTVSALWIAGTDDAWAAAPFERQLYHWNGLAWTAQDAGFAARSLWGIGPGDVWAGGVGGALHFDGTTWTNVPFPSLPGGGVPEAAALWGAGTSNVWAAGPGGILHWDGVAWTVAHPTTAAHFQGLGGSGPADVWAVGDGGQIAHWNGSTWTGSTAPINATLHAVWAWSPSDAWAVGEMGVTLHWDGASWRQVPSGTLDLLLGVWGAAADDVIAVGDAGSMLSWNGVAWSLKPGGNMLALRSLYGVTGKGAGDVRAFGEQGTILGR